MVKILRNSDDPETVVITGNEQYQCAYCHAFLSQESKQLKCPLRVKASHMPISLNLVPKKPKITKSLQKRDLVISGLPSSHAPAEAQTLQQVHVQSEQVEMNDQVIPEPIPEPIPEQIIPEEPECVQVSSDSDDQEPMMLINKQANLHGWQVCALCEKPTEYPVLSCTNCLMVYHNQCYQQRRGPCTCRLSYWDLAIRQGTTVDDIIDRNKESLIDAADAVLARGPRQKRIFTPPPLWLHLSHGNEQMDTQQAQLRTLTSTDKSREGEPLLISMNASTTCFITPWVTARTCAQADQDLIDNFSLRLYTFPVKVSFINQYIGRGLRATRKVYESEILAPYSGDIINDSQLVASFTENNCLFDLNPTDYTGPYNRYSIVPCFSGHFGHLANHSDISANAVPEVVWTSNGVYVFLKATRNIAAGEEILWNYGKRYIGMLPKAPLLAKLKAVAQRTVNALTKMQPQQPWSNISIMARLGNIIDQSKLYKSAVFSDKFFHSFYFAWEDKVCFFDLLGRSDQVIMKLMRFLAPRIVIIRCGTIQPWACGHAVVRLAKDLRALSEDHLRALTTYTVENPFFIVQKSSEAVEIK